MEKYPILLQENSLWEGPLRNFVQQQGGMKQEGRNRLEITHLDSGYIELCNTFIRSDGTPTDYQGITKIKIEGDRIFCPESEAVDANTGNPIKNRVFEGYCLSNHIYIFEQYEEVMGEGKVDRRRNELHYYIINEREVLNLVSVYVNEKLLVFGHAHLEKK